MASPKRAHKFLDCIPKTLRKQIELEEQQFLLQALDLRKELLTSLLALLENPERHSVKDLATALKIIQEQISSAKREIASLSAEPQQNMDELADLDLPDLNLSSEEILTA